LENRHRIHWSLFLRYLWKRSLCHEERHLHRMSNRHRKFIYFTNCRRYEIQSCSGLSVDQCNACSSHLKGCPLNQTLAKCYVAPKRPCQSEKECTKKGGYCTDQQFYVSLATVPPTVSFLFVDEPVSKLSYELLHFNSLEPASLHLPFLISKISLSVVDLNRLKVGTVIPGVDYCN